MTSYFRTALAFLLLASSPAYATWQPDGGEFRVNTTTAGAQENPVAAFATGTLVVAWPTYQDFARMQRYATNGVPLGIETVMQGGANAVAARGLVPFFVEVHEVDFSGVYFQRFDIASGAPVSGFVQVAATPGVFAKGAEVAMDANGNIVVVWSNQPLQDIYARQYDSSGTALGPGFAVNTGTGDTGESAVAMLAGGNFVVVWQRWNSPFGTAGRLYSPNGTPLTNEISLIAAGDVSNQHLPRVEPLPDGGFVVVMEGYDQSGPPGCQCPDFGVWARLFNANGTPRGPEFRVNTTISGWQEEPDVAVNSDGSFIVVWNNDAVYEELGDVMRRHYASDGTPETTELRVNSASRSMWYLAAAADLSSDTQIVVWDGNGPGDVDGIFAQRFVRTAPVPTYFHAVNGSVSEQGVRLDWDVTLDGDVQGFEVTREGAVDGNTPSVLTKDLLNPATREFVDRSVLPGGVYSYVVYAVDRDGARISSPPVAVDVPTIGLALEQNIPNPFNPSTEIQFRLPESAMVQLDVFDVSGRHVRRLASGGFGPGAHEVTWDGRDSAGNPASSGIYLYRLSAGKQSISRRMVLLK